MKQTRWFQPNLVDFWFYLSFWFVGFLETVFVFLVLESKKPKKSWKKCFFINKYHFTFFLFFFEMCWNEKRKKYGTK